MMLLNLKKIREDEISEKLVDYKIHQDLGHFMDQDCLNAVFQENVIYVSPIYNWMAPNQLKYSSREIQDFFGIDFEPTTENAVVVHLTNRKKVWNYVSVWGHDLWMKYYNKEEYEEFNKSAEVYCDRMEDFSADEIYAILVIIEKTENLNKL
jgi:lipopolysaccharide biosynthesis glycosyltransferase